MVRPFRIVAFGSSSTEGSGATSPARTYPAQLATLLGHKADRPVEVLNRGVGGDDIHAMMARLDRDVVAARPNLVIWQAGSNDPLCGVPSVDFAAALGMGLDTLLSLGIEAMLMEPQWSPVLAEADPDQVFVAAVRTVAAARSLACIRRYDLMKDWFDTGRVRPAEVIGPDGLHMTDLGYRLLAEATAAAVTEHAASFAAYRA